MSEIMTVRDLLAEIDDAVRAGMDIDRARVVLRVQTEPAVYRRGIGVRAKYAVAPLRSIFRGGQRATATFALEACHFGFLDGNEAAFEQWKEDPNRRKRT